MDGEAFATVMPALSEEEIQVLEWAGITQSDQVQKLDETCDIVGVEPQPDTLKAAVGVATLIAAQIAMVFNAYKIRDELTIVSAVPVDFK